MPKMSPNWSQRGSQNGTKIIKSEVLEASCFKVGSQVASRIDFVKFLGLFWDHFCEFFFEMAFWWPWPPFGLPKHLQNETQKGAKIKTWKSWIFMLFTIREPHWRVLKIIIFRCFLGVSKSMQKWYPKSHQNCLQKGPQKWAKIIKMGSKSHPKMGFRKNIEKWWFSAPLNVAQV